MDKEAIYKMVIREMTEQALSERRETSDEEERRLYRTAGELSKRADEIANQLPPEKRQVLEDYFVNVNLIADHECQHLYVQGAKDCVELLKKLGVL